MFEQTTQNLYRRALDRGQRRLLWSMLTGRSRSLLHLASVEANCGVRACCNVGLRSVPIARICGSEGRACDFDCDFNPLQNNTQDRWLAIAAARRRGRVLPPVALIQVGDVYFVRDGHHRVSVARALGHVTIDATVEVWQVDKPVPWDALGRASNRRPPDQGIGVERVFERLWREGARLQEHTLLILHNLLSAVRQPRATIPLALTAASKYQVPS
jgi:hypothetical protein